jgi:hypothetical protein
LGVEAMFQPTILSKEPRSRARDSQGTGVCCVNVSTGIGAASEGPVRSSPAMPVVGMLLAPPWVPSAGFEEPDLGSD